VTIDVCMKNIDESFLDEIDEIMEDSMIGIFIVHIQSKEELEKIKIVANKFNSIFYATNIELKDFSDKNCVGYTIENHSQSTLLNDANKTIFINEESLSNEVIKTLSEAPYKGIILNATKEHSQLENFYISFGEENISKFNIKDIENISMDKIVLESSYPKYGFDSIEKTVKIISDALLRPEQSIIARATKNSLALFDF